MDTSKVFGDLSKFAIIYRPCPDDYNYDKEDNMAICHMFIGNKIIGRANEECYLPTWFYNMTRIRDFITTNKDNLYPQEFESLLDREIFEIIIKANQLDDEFDERFLYLPQLDNSIWQRHFLTIDETIDAFSICYFVKNSVIKFIIENSSSEGHKKENASLFCESLDVNDFISVLNQTIDFLETTYPLLAKSKNRENFNSS